LSEKNDVAAELRQKAEDRLIALDQKERVQPALAL
jgi:hypothetical protein